MPDEIPDPLKRVLTDDEVENIRNRDGWALGTIALFDKGERQQTHEDAYIELFNGDGGAGQFGGVKAHAVESGELTEVYAYATLECFEAGRAHNKWVVTEYTDPEDPDYGEPMP